MSTAFAVISIIIFVLATYREMILLVQKTFSLNAYTDEKLNINIPY